MLDSNSEGTVDQLFKIYQSDDDTIALKLAFRIDISEKLNDNFNTWNTSLKPKLAAK